MRIPASGPLSTNATLTFSIPPPDGIPAQQMAIVDPQTGQRARNYGREQRAVLVENLRGKEHSAALDATGFQLIHSPAKHNRFTSEDEIRAEYYPEGVSLLKEFTGASTVVVFHHTIRRRRVGVRSYEPGQPAPATHVDQSPAGAVAFVHRLFPSEASSLLQRRFQIINVWRPISHPAFDWPLALCDYRTVAKDDVFPVAREHPDHPETLAVRFNDGQRWMYYYGVTPEEVILLKCFDSVQDGSVAVFTPHTAFEDPATPQGAPMRESIELRALVFY